MPRPRQGTPIVSVSDVEQTIERFKTMPESALRTRLRRLQRPNKIAAFWHVAKCIGAMDLYEDCATKADEMDLLNQLSNAYIPSVSGISWSDVDLMRAGIRSNSLEPIDEVMDHMLERSAVFEDSYTMPEGIIEENNTEEDEYEEEDPNADIIVHPDGFLEYNEQGSMIQLDYDQSEVDIVAELERRIMDGAEEERNMALNALLQLRENMKLNQAMGIKEAPAVNDIHPDELKEPVRKLTFRRKK